MKLKIEEFSEGEISRRLNRNLGTVRSELRRGKEKLRQAFAQREKIKV